MREIVERGATSQISHVFIPDSTLTTGGGKTGLTHNSAGLKIAVIRPGEAAPTKYLQSAGSIEDITTLGTYQAPSTNKVRFKEIDATDMQGWYEIHWPDALFNTTSSRRSLGGMISGATGVAPTPFLIQLSDPAKGVGSPSNLDAAITTRAAASIFTGITSLAQWLGLMAGKQVGDTTARTEIRATGAGSGTFDETADSQEALRDRGDAAWTTATGFSTHSAADVWSVGSRTLTSVGTLVADIWSHATRTLTAISDSSGVTTLLSRLSAGRATALDNLDATVSSRLAAASYTAPLDAAGTRSAVGLASANLDTQLAALAGYVDAEVAQVVADLATLLGRLTATRAGYLDNLSAGVVPTVSDIRTGAVAAELDAVVPDSIPADGSRPSMRQAAYMGTQFLVERDVNGTSVTVKKPNGDPLFTLMLNDATNPTSVTRAS